MSRSTRRGFLGLCFFIAGTLLLWTESTDWYRVDSAQGRVLRGNVGTGNDSPAHNNSHLSGLGAREAEQLLEHSPRIERARVLLMSYMRSGSTFTGDVFQAMPGVFYLYEPLLYVNDDDYMEEKARPAKLRLMTHARGLANAPEIHNYTLDMLKCQLSDANLRFLFGMRFSNSTIEFEECSKALGVKPKLFGECGDRLRERCEQSSAVVAKILRLKMWEIERILVEDPDLKIIHLVRDPRGISVSRRTVRYFFGETAFCNRLNLDSRVSARLQKMYPDRILTTRYEDLATDPRRVAKILFEFSGIPWSADMERSIHKMTANSDQQTLEHSFNTMRKNSSLTAFNWRQQISFQTATKIQQLCQESMEVYGYVPFDTQQDLLNQSISSILPDYSDLYNKAQVVR